MRNLTEEEKDIVKKRFGRNADMVIRQVEKLKLEYDFEEAVDFAWDIILQNAE